MVRAWNQSIPRSYFAAGIGKSTEDAVGRILLAAEGKRADEESAGFILDIDKCYENVDHEKLMEAAVRHEFPLFILRLCIKMYRSRRTVAWDSVFGKTVRTSQTLVPGCSIALWLLQLLMITPLDNYVDSVPPQVQQPEIYVDDGTVLVIGKKGTVEDITVKAAKGLANAFEVGASLPVSRSKGRVVASDAKLAGRIAGRLRTPGPGNYMNVACSSQGHFALGHYGLV